MLAIVLVMAVISLSFASQWQAQERHDTRELERLQSHARGLAMLAARDFAGGDYRRDSLEQLLFESSAQLGGSYELLRLRSDGSIERVAAVGVHAGFAELPAPPQDFATPSSHSFDRYNLIVIDEPVPTRDGQLVNLRLVAEHSPWMRTQAWRDTLFVAGGVGVLLLVLGGLLLELQVLRPIRALEAAIAQVESGRLEASAPTDGPRELAEIGAAFNEMLASLRSQQDELARAGQKLQRSERLAAIGRISAGVAHEVGNPLAAIVGYTEILLSGPDLPAEDQDILERVQAQTQRIQAIVAQLLDYAKQSEPRTLAFSPIARAQEVLTLLRADPRCAEVELELVGDPELELLADPALFEQILLNLVLNAVQALRDQPDPSAPPLVRVLARLEPESDTQLRVEVRDNGPGVPEDIREQLFDPFFTTRGAGEGTGLGLAVSQGLAERMEGTLEYVDDPRSRGATFRLTLPRAE